VVVCDTTALMTAVYSRIVFGDRSLDDEALRLHAGMALTLLMALDLPWVADGHQRDGPQVRQPVDCVLRELLLAQGLPFTVIEGQGQARVENALAAVAPLLRG
jgi:nicotinamide riboside kinase